MKVKKIEPANCRIIRRGLLLLIGLFGFGQLQAQTDEAQQLLLNVEKLAQLKNILQTMYEGYELLSQGYQTIQDLSEGNFSLHRQFLDALLEVSPTVKKGHRVAMIIQMQGDLVKRYRRAWQQFRQVDTFTPEELRYISGVYQHLFRQSTQSLDDLLTVLTAGTLRMDDAERLRRIDQIYEEVEGQILFLRQFNHSTGILAAQRAQAIAEIKRLKKWYPNP